MGKSKNLSLVDGAEIAVIGGGPAGAFYSIYALKLAKDLGKKVNLRLFDRKTFTNQGPPGCNMCAGVISETMVQHLAIDGINLPPSVVQRSIGSYCFHTPDGKVYIKSPRLRQSGIATTYRGGGPKGSGGENILSLDEFMLQKAEEEGAVIERTVIDEIKLTGDRPTIYSNKKPLMEPDLLVGAFGVNARTVEKFRDLGFGYVPPGTIRCMQTEMGLGKEWVNEHFGDAIHVFLLNMPGVKFAAIIPKSNYATISMLGKDVNKDTVKTFVAHPVLRKMLPEGWELPDKFCHCFPKIALSPSQKPFADRIVIIGDASSTRLYKEGIGSAYITSKSAAYTTMLYGVSEKDFSKHYYPTCKGINKDNMLGKLLFTVNDYITSSPLLSKGYFRTVRREQENMKDGTPEEALHSAILWDMFTGGRNYTEIFYSAIGPRSQLSLIKGFLGELWSRYITSRG
ncbi:MAG: NAD(P)/FAD-dependent oxidoreductase [Planctomycetota bacterium]